MGRWETWGKQAALQLCSSSGNRPAAKTSPVPPVLQCGVNQAYLVDGGNKGRELSLGADESTVVSRIALVMSRTSGFDGVGEVEDEALACSSRCNSRNALECFWGFCELGRMFPYLWIQHNP